MSETVVIRNLYTALSAVFNKAFGDAKPQWQKVATQVPSSASENDYGWLGDWPSIEEWMGERQLATLKEHGYSIKNKTWESSIKVRREKVEDDQLGMYTIQAQQIGYDASMHPDSLVFPLLMNGFNELCYDGQYFFDEDHPMGNGTHSNVQLETAAAPAAKNFAGVVEHAREDGGNIVLFIDTELNRDLDQATATAASAEWVLSVGAKTADIVSFRNETGELVVTGGTLVLADLTEATELTIKG
ncbi:Mu-like prophage major head subunit gpT family protein, partial [Vibrio scophthalmi]